MECHDGNRGSHSRSLATSAGSGARVPCPLTRRELLRLPPNLRAWPSCCQVVTGAPPPPLRPDPPSNIFITATGLLLRLTSKILRKNVAGKNTWNLDEFAKIREPCVAVSSHVPRVGRLSRHSAAGQEGTGPDWSKEASWFFGG